MVDELIDICDEDNNLTGVQKMKSEAHKTGLWHRASHIWIYNSVGEILLQLRSKEKLLYPNTWDISVAGHVTASEDPVVSALREIQEEIGLEVEVQDLEFIKIIKKPDNFRDIVNNEFYYVYLMKFDGDIKDLKLQKEEVQKIGFFKVSFIKKDVKENPQKYVPHGDFWLEICDEVNKRI